MKPMDERGEFLIQEGIRLGQAIAALRAKLHLIENELDGYFPKAAYVEHVATIAGTAHRILQEDIHLDPARAHEVMASLASQFETYFTTLPWCRPTDACRERLASPDSHVGAYLQDYLVFKRARHFAFSPGRTVLPVTVQRSP